MNKYLTEGLEKFLKNQESKKEDKKSVKILKESLKLKESFGTRVANWYDRTYDNAFEAEREYGSHYFTIGTSLGKVKEVDDYMKFLGDMLEKYDPSLEKEIDKVIDGMSNEDKKIIAKHYGIYLDPKELSEVAKDGEGLDEGCNKQLKEETNMDKINKYLVSIGEAPITESIKEDTEAMGNFDKIMAAVDGKPVSASNKDSNYDKVMKKVKDLNSTPLNYDKVKKAIDDKKSAPSNYDKIVKTLGESKKSVKRSTNLMESLNSGFSKLYGDFDDTKSLNEACGKKTRKPLKEYKDMGQDLDEYQKWVDYDMKKYHKISDNTMSKIKKAGLSVVKDQYGQYEVIAKEADKDSDKDSKK